MNDEGGMYVLPDPNDNILENKPPEESLVITPPEDITTLPPEESFHERKHRAETAKQLAFRLIWILVGSGFLHYAVTAYLRYYEKNDAAENLSQIFEVWLPVISGFVGSTVAYYFSKEN